MLALATHYYRSPPPSLFLFYPFSHFVSAWMANFQDPATIVNEQGACGFSWASVACSPIYQSVPSIVALVKLWHLADGMFM